MPRDEFDFRSLKDIYTEISILQKLSHLKFITKLYDYGVTEDSIYMVLQSYKTDLLSWRKNIQGNISGTLRLIFKIFLEITKALALLHDAGVYHFDMKCSNILIDFPDDINWYHSDISDFNIVISDFGEAVFTHNTKNQLDRPR